MNSATTTMPQRKEKNLETISQALRLRHTDPSASINHTGTRAMQRTNQLYPGA
uniref:Uncharacterized protein n=1 Tax=Oryza brachyantha TaxID=4533 RepID=J3L9L3_ORYBR